MLKALSTLAVGGCLLIAAPSAQAVPATGLSLDHPSIVQDAYWRHRHHRCWWRYGHRHCRWWW